MAKKPTQHVPIQEALDWKLDKGQTLRQALVDEAEKVLEVTNESGSIDITVEGDNFVATFTGDTY